MNRLTTDTPHGNFETMMNFAYAKNGEVWIRGVGAHGEDMRLNEYIFDVMQGDKNYCEVDHPDDFPEFCLDACFCEFGALFAAATQAAELRARLAAYEDTGLEPDEAEACKVALTGKNLAEIKEIEGISVERMKDLAKAEAEGRLLVLPCKVGDRVWLIVQGMSSPMPVPVCSLTWRDGKWSINADREETEPPKVVGFQIGKTAFLTREKAEAALKVGGEDG